MGRMSPEKEALGLTHDQLNPGKPENTPKYSDIVYQTGGPNRCGQGSSFKSRGVSSEKEHNSMLKNGWFNTPGEAINLGEDEANKVRFVLGELRKEQKLEEDRAELEELLKRKAEREAKKKNKVGRPSKSISYTQ